MRVDASRPTSFPDLVEDIASGATFYMPTADGPIAYIMVTDVLEDVIHDEDEPWPTRTALRLTDCVLVELDPWEPACARALKLVDDEAVVG